jgi:hypothetical protein
VFIIYALRPPPIKACWRSLSLPPLLDRREVDARPFLWSALGAEQRKMSDRLVYLKHRVNDTVAGESEIRPAADRLRGGDLGCASFP